MAIVSHYTLAESGLQSDGRRLVIHVFVDQDAVEHSTLPHPVPASWGETEYTAAREALAPIYQDDLQASELSRAVEYINNGNDIALFTVVHHASRQVFDQALSRALASHPDILVALGLVDFYAYMQSITSNNNQIRDYLAFTQPEVNAVIARAQALGGVKNAIIADAPVEFAQ